MKHRIVVLCSVEVVAGGGKQALRTRKRAMMATIAGVF